MHEPLYRGLYPFKREVHMAVVLHVRRHTHNVHAIFVKPFCSALCHKVIRIVAEQTYHCVVCTLWVFTKEARGMGLMRGLECDAPVGEICAKALDKGLLLLTAGTNVIRFVPPLVIKEEHVDQMAEILTEVLKEFE